MSIAATGGPHTVSIFRKVTTFAANNSPIDGFEFVANKTCFVLPLTADETADLSKKGLIVNGMITFFADPGVIDAKTFFLFSNRGVREIHECRGFVDQCNLGRVFTAYTFFSTSLLIPLTCPSAFSASGSSSAVFTSA